MSSDDGGADGTPDLLESLRSLLSDRDDARDRLEQLDRDVARRMRACRASGVSWADIAEVTRFPTPEAARQWAKKFAAETGPRDDGGVTIAEAARRLGISRPTVYARLRAGELDAVIDGQGRTRIKLD